eukprot:15455205-Alexandrium_andersonii.AAC.1
MELGANSELHEAAVQASPKARMINSGAWKRQELETPSFRTKPWRRHASRGDPRAQTCDWVTPKFAECPALERTVRAFGEAWTAA